MQGRKGRPSKDYEMADGTKVEGLYRRGDGRWVVKATGFTFTERDERLAVKRFRQLTEGKNKVTMPGQAVRPYSGKFGQGVTINHPDLGKVAIDSQELWDYVRELLITKPVYVAERVGLPQLIHILQMPMPGRSPKLDDILTAYEQNADVLPRTKSKMKKVVKEFVRLTGFETLRDFEVEKLKEYRETIKARDLVAESISNIFGRIVTLVRYGFKEGLDEAELQSALNKLKVLHVATEQQEAEATPITPEDFCTLLGGAGVEQRAFLLISLNFCMYTSEALSVEWDEIDFKRGTFLSRRNKTGVRRAATLWPETIEAIKQVQRRGMSQYVFTSTHGTKYNTNGYIEKFARLREAVGLPDTVQHNQIRDGAYTASCSAGVAMQLCRALAGHKLAGEVDKYLGRNPGMVRPACDAVYKEYAPFPASVPAIKVGRPRKVTTAA